MVPRFGSASLVATAMNTAATPVAMPRAILFFIGDLLSWGTSPAKIARTIPDRQIAMLPRTAIGYPFEPNPPLPRGIGLMTRASFRSSLAIHAICALLLLHGARASAQATDPGLRRLESEISRLSSISGGRVGVGIIHLETGRELFVNGAEPYPMASTVKVPIAVELLTRVQAGTVRLDSMITLQNTDLHPGSGTLTGLFNDPGVSLSVHNLLELMLLISDNSATDIVLKVAGSGTAVNARLSALGIRGISVDRPTIELIADVVGVKNLGPETG